MEIFFTEHDVWKIFQPFISLGIQNEVHNLYTLYELRYRMSIVSLNDKTNKC